MQRLFDFGRKRNDSTNGTDTSGSSRAYTIRDAVAKLDLNTPGELHQAPDGKNDTSNDAVSIRLSVCMRRLLVDISRLY